jgi:hypothetical protein
MVRVNLIEDAVTRHDIYYIADLDQFQVLRYPGGVRYIYLTPSAFYRYFSNTNKIPHDDIWLRVLAEMNRLKLEIGKNES